MITEQEWESIKVDASDDQARIQEKQAIVSNLIQRERQQKKLTGAALAEAEKMRIDRKNVYKQTCEDLRALEQRDKALHRQQLAEHHISGGF